MKKILFTIFVITLLSLSLNVHAQYQSPIDGVTISINPEKPGPNDDVSVSVESYLIDLSSASIIWLADGKDIGHGVGMKNIKIKAPSAGKKLTITSVIKSSNGKEVRKVAVIKSGSVEILWETPKSYSPPFFKGKNPFVYENWIRLIAVPHLSTDGVKELDPKVLVYKWKKDGKYIENGSGYGIQSVDIKADEIPKPLDISVEVYTRDQNESAVAFLKLEPVEPSVSFYEVDPLYGIYFNKTIPNYISLQNSEITLLASPFGFNYNPLNKKLSYIWSVNNIEQSNLNKNQSITLRSKDNIEGSSNISIDIRNENDILERALSSITINFKKRVVEEDNTAF